MEKLPPSINFNSVALNKACANANFKIGELNGLMMQLPNPNIVLNVLITLEAKDSSAIENIITTYDKIYQGLSDIETDLATKEVIGYKRAIEQGYKTLLDNQFISINSIIEIQQIIEPDKGGIRRLPGTVIKNTATNTTIYTPPQSEAEIREYLANLEQYINNNDDEYDPLIKMGVINYQFEAIHPFYDGNGRTGRLLNVLYLVLCGKIKYPIVYLSNYIIRNKADYYRLLQETQDSPEKLLNFVEYLLNGITESATLSIQLVEAIVKDMDKTGQLLKQQLPKIYSHELIEHLYFNFYTKIEFMTKDLHITRNTAAKHLKALVMAGFLESKKVGKSMVYVNLALQRLIDQW